MKRLYQILNIFLGCSIGVFLGSCAYRYWDFKAHPDFCAMQPAPWYCASESAGSLHRGTGRHTAGCHGAHQKESG